MDWENILLMGVCFGASLVCLAYVFSEVRAYSRNVFYLVLCAMSSSFSIGVVLMWVLYTFVGVAK